MKQDKVRIKICGLMEEEDCILMNEVRPDLVGFVFAKTRHFLTDMKARELRSHLDPEIPAVGVFVDEPADHVAELVRSGIIQAVQLHGNEDSDYVSLLRSKTCCPIIKAARVRTGKEPLAAQELPCDMLLLDAYDPDTPGGSGRRFKLDLIPELHKPFFIAGGIDADNVEHIIREARPYGVDLSSALEIRDADGRLHKDRDKVIRFMQNFSMVNT